MTWNYRVVKKTVEFMGKSEDCYEIHEVYYNEDGSPRGMSKEPTVFSGETPEELVECLERAIKAIKEKDVFIPPETWV